MAAHNNNDDNSFSLKDLAEAMKEPTNKKIDISGHHVDKNEAYEKLYSVVNEFAQAADKNASADLEESRKFANSVIDLISSFKKSKKEKSAVPLDSISYLKRIADSTESMSRSFNGKNNFWVGVNKLSDNVQKEIVNSLKLSGCCGSKTKKTILSGIKNNQQPSNSKKASNFTSTIKKVTAPRVSNIQPTIASVANSGGAGGGGSGGGSGSGSSSSGGSGGGSNNGPDDFSDTKVMSKGKIFGFMVASVLGNVLKDITNALDLRLNKMWEGVVVDSFKFRTNLRAIVFEQQGFGRLNREIEESYKGIHNAALASGLETGRFQEMYTKNLERGLSYSTKEDKLNTRALAANKKEASHIKFRTDRMKSIQASAGNTASMLHMNADTLNDIFMDWHYNIGLSEISIGEMGRHMQSIARNSGVTGTRLENALKSSANIIKELQKAGAATPDAMKNVTQIMAVSEKYGIGEQASEMLNALTSYDNFMNSDKRRWLFRSAANISPELVNEVRTGSALDNPESVKKLMEGQRKETYNLLRNFEASFIEAKVLKPGQSVEDIPIEKLSQAVQQLRGSGPEGALTAARLEKLFKFQNVDINMVQQFDKVLQEYNRGPLESIKEFKKQLKEMKAGGFDGTDEYKRVQSLLTQSQNDLSMNVFGKLSEFSAEIKANQGKITAGSDLESKIVTALNRDFNGNKDQALDFVRNIHSNSKEFAENLRNQAKVSGHDIDSLIKERGFKGGLNHALKEAQVGDVNALRAIQESIQRMGITDKAKDDPISYINEQFRVANDYLRRIAEWGLGILPAGLEKWLLMGGMALNTLGGIFGILVAWQTAKTLLGGIGKGPIFGGKGGPMMGGPMGPMGPTGTGGPKGAGGPHAGAGGPKGRWGRMAGFFSRHSGKISTIGGGVLGAAGGYYLGDGDASSTILGGLGGATAGYYGNRWLSSKTGGGVNSAVSGANVASDLMSGMPGWGGNCVPVCIVGGLSNLGLQSSSIGSMALDALNVADVALDARSMAGGGVNKVKALDKVDDAVKASKIGGWLNKIPYYDKLSQGVAKTASKLTDVGSKAASFTSNVTSKAGSMISKSPIINKALSMSGYAASKFAVPLGVGIGGLSGYLNAANEGRSSLEGVGYGVLTGGVEKGSFISDMVGIKKGSATDEVLGIGGAATNGAILGGAVGGFLAPVTAGLSVPVGAGIGAGISSIAEIAKIFTAESSGIKTALYNFGSGLVSGVSNFIQGVGSVSSGFVTAASNVIGSAMTGISDTVSYASNGVVTAVDSAIKAGSSLASGVYQAGSSVVTGAKNIGNSALKTGQAALSYLNPFNYFEEGTRSVEQSGIAVIHKGEMIIPSRIWENIKGIGSGSFGNSSDIYSVFENLQSSALDDKLNKSLIEKAAMNMLGISSLNNTGAFDNNQASEAIDSEVNYDTNKTFATQDNDQAKYPDPNNMLKEAYSKINKFSNDVSYLEEGAFRSAESKDASEESYNNEIKKLTFNAQTITDLLNYIPQTLSDLYTSKKSISEVLGETFETIKQIPKAGLNMLSMGLFDPNNSVEANDEYSNRMIKGMSITDINSSVERAFGNKEIFNSPNGNDNVSSNLMDYRDTLKGEVGALSVNRAMIERNVAQQYYGSQSSGNNVVPNIDSISDYLLNIQSSKFDKMIEHLEAIRSNTNGSNQRTIIGSNTRGVPYSASTGVKNIARDTTRGLWDLTYGDHTPGSVTTEGRG